MHEILVLGAGYAGLMAATSLAGRTARRDDVRITLVNGGDRFTERLRLHQVATGQRLAELSIPAVLAGTNARLVTGWVTAIDPAARTVRVDDERVLRYDTLVYALGGVAATGAVAGADEHAYALDGAPAAEALARRLAEVARPGGGSVAVCGTGLTGIELATEIAERHPGLAVTLLGTAAPGAGLGRRARAHLDGALARLGIRVLAGAEVVKVLPGVVALAGGATVEADVVVWAAGVRVPPLAAAAGLTVDGSGRIVVDGALRSVSHPEIYAIGDAAAIRQGFGVLHGTCQSGMPTGAHAAWNIARELDGREPGRFRFGYLHLPVSLGRGDAVVQFTRPDGSPKRLALTGRAAVWYKETVSSSPWPSFQRILRSPGAGRLAWRRGGRRTR
ncbi:NAD(P)/FAD-dependent oxidoreductase [Actinoplanes flavus]|uniref:FAD-dependent oxidoreductase n=1 Tax=Actinoplanes flavus TaxID=2820290 RepID=A0ABS3UYD0_9ACTN|nr:FAD-dependent oxidoreductase [Actinoplanes flavus]MBO3743592.1 FAD-dependent oxidoreductase [Actinoplanes flavus]